MSICAFKVYKDLLSDHPVLFSNFVNASFGETMPLEQTKRDIMPDIVVATAKLFDTSARTASHHVLITMRTNTVMRAKTLVPAEQKIACIR